MTRGGGARFRTRLLCSLDRSKGATEQTRVQRHVTIAPFDLECDRGSVMNGMAWNGVGSVLRVVSRASSFSPRAVPSVHSVFRLQPFVHTKTARLAQYQQNNSTFVVSKCSQLCRRWRGLACVGCSCCGLAVVCRLHSQGLTLLPISARACSLSSSLTRDRPHRLSRIVAFVVSLFDPLLVLRSSAARSQPDPTTYNQERRAHRRRSTAETILHFSSCLSWKQSNPDDGAVMMASSSSAPSLQDLLTEWEAATKTADGLRRAADPLRAADPNDNSRYCAFPILTAKYQPASSCEGMARYASFIWEPVQQADLASLLGKRRIVLQLHQPLWKDDISKDAQGHRTCDTMITIGKAWEIMHQAFKKAHGVSGADREVWECPWNSIIVMDLHGLVDKTGKIQSSDAGYKLLTDTGIDVVLALQPRAVIVCGSEPQKCWERFLVEKPDALGTIVWKKAPHPSSDSCAYGQVSAIDSHLEVLMEVAESLAKTKSDGESAALSAVFRTDKERIVKTRVPLAKFSR